MQSNPLDAYTSIQKETISGRDLEAAVLIRAGVMLKCVREAWDSSDRDDKLMEAITFNQKVWSFFQAELADPENPLPQNIRQDILNLSLFIDKRLLEVMVNPDPQRLDIVIDINFNLAAGLRERGDSNAES